MDDWKESDPDASLVPQPPTPEHLLGLSFLPGGQRFADYFRDEAGRKQEQMLSVIRDAVDRLDDSLQEILDRIRDDPPRRRLLNETLRAAYATEHGEKLRWLGYLLASGLLLQDDAKVDEIARVVQTVARVDPADVRVLYLISRPTRSKFVVRAELIDRYAEAETVMDSILATLEREGLIFDKGSTANDFWSPTAFGQLLLRTLHDAGLAELLGNLPHR
jgi:hypothetical protein